METRNKIAFSFYVKRTKPLKSGEVPIYLKIKVDDTHEELATLRNIFPEKWSVAKNGAAGTSKEAKELNVHLQHVVGCLNEHVKMLREKDREITARTIKNSYLGIINDEKKIVELFQEHNKTIKLLSLKDKDFAPATVQRYETCLLHLSSYIKEKYKVNDLLINKMNADFIKGFELYLKTVRNCAHNTTMKYIKNFKKIVLNAFRNGWLKHDPFVNFKLRLKKVDKEFLTEDELARLLNKKIGIERLEFVKDVFLFGCFTGLAYSDIKNLKQENVVKGENGRLWIHTRRKKTDMISHIPLLPIALQIVEKYRNNPYCIVNEILLPVYTNQKLNAYLKEIADICGITKHISTHTARHTFATTVTLNNDVPIESVSKMLGHSTIKMTQHYAKLSDKKVGIDMEKIQDKFTTEKVSLHFPPICQN
ncbi:MAG: site-specific integrase [Bacteroidia bacterium]|nr:site-specific integrase [Bacteroidia bacterium]